MAKHKKDDDTDLEQTPSNTMSGGKVPKATDGPADAEKGEGVAHYPPSPSDQSGEKTDNVPPSKQLPPDVPKEEGGAAPAGTTKRATVNGVEVEFPADAKNADTAAIEAYKVKAGIWSLPDSPTVVHSK